MRNTWLFILCTSISIILLVFLSRSIQLGDTRLPPLGDFLNPFTGFWNQAESGKAGSHETYSTDFLEDSINIEFDKRFVPHVFARNDADAFYAQGFLHAKHRLFQMDLTSRAMAGRLSELLGSRTLAQDVFARRINFPAAVENKYKSWSRHPDMMELAEAYVRGVNEYISRLKPKDYPIEYKLINGQPELWSLRKTVSISISLAATLNLNLSDFEHTNTLLSLGSKNFKKMFPPFPDSLLPVDIEKQYYPDSVPELAPQIYDQFSYMPTENPMKNEPGVGSNNWAVNAILTKDSIPMVANDPHLPLNLPSIWYELQIHTPEYSTHGVSVPGMPSIVIGFNNYAAWGLTNAPIDVLDSYKIKWSDKKRGKYLLDGQEKSASLRTETIIVKGEENHVEEIYDTYWGPVLFADSLSQHQDIAVKWMSRLPSEKCDFRALFNLMKARDLEDYQAALEHFYVPGQNIVFASTEDSIAITVQGKFPIKRPNQGRFIMDGSLTSNDWQGIIPMKDLPRMVNPERKYVISANEWPTYPEYPYYYSGNFDQYRGRAIAGFLDTLPPLTVESMQLIQNSTFNLKAAEILPTLLQLLPAKVSDQTLADSLVQWDYEYQANSPLPTFTELWIQECSDLTFDELKPSDTFPLLHPPAWRLGELLIQNPNDIIFDRVNTPKVRETARNIVLTAWENAVDKYRNIQPEKRKWGRFAGLSITHMLKIPEFSHLNLMTGGNGNTINAITKKNGPSWRMIVELARDSVSGHVIYPGGQSGNPGSKYYDNFIDDWLHGKYYKVQLARKPIEVSESIHYSIQMLPK